MFYALRNIIMRWGWSTQSTEGMGDIGMGMPPTNRRHVGCASGLHTPGG